MPTPNSKALPKSSEDHSTFATKSGENIPYIKNILLKPTDGFHFVSQLQNLLKVLNISKTGHQKSDDTYLDGEIERDTPHSSDLGLSVIWTAPMVSCQTLTKVLTIWVLLDLMIV